MKKLIIKTITISWFLTAISVGAANAGTLENLERERAIALVNLMSLEITPSERQAKLRNLKPRLVDLERMVMRDPSLKGKNTPDVHRAFNNYDTTFLMHASIEKNRTIVDHWFEQMGLSTNALMNTKVGRR
jgi:hypothetical protein